MTKRFRTILSIAIAFTLVFALAVPVTAASDTHRVSGQNSVFLGTTTPGFVVFSDGQVGSIGGGQNVVVWTPDGAGDWDAIKAGITAAGQAPGWMTNNNYTFHGFFTGVGFANAFDGGQNHFFSVEEIAGRWYAVKRNSSGNISGTISNTIFYGDINVPQFGALEVTVEAEQTTVTTTRIENWERTITPTRTLTKYVSQNFSSVTVTTPEQWELRTCPTVINTRNRNPIHPNNRNAGWYNPLVVFNANHFAFASLCHQTLAYGYEIPLVLVVGNNFNQVGNGVVSYEDGYLTITFEYGLFSGSWGALSFNNMLGVPNNGNIHSIGGNVNNTRNAMIALGAPTYTAFSHNIRTNTVTIPAANPTAAGYIYLYIHGTFSFLLDYHYSDFVDVVTDETLMYYYYDEVSVTNPVDTAAAVIVVRNVDNEIVAEGTGSSLSVPNLPPGEYTVTVEFAGQVLYETDLVVVDETTYFEFEFTLPNIYIDGGVLENWTTITLDPVTNVVIVRR